MFYKNAYDYKRFVQHIFYEEIRKRLLLYPCVSHDIFTVYGFHHILWKVFKLIITKTDLYNFDPLNPTFI